MSETAPVTSSSEQAPRQSVFAWLGFVLLVAIFGLSVWYYPPLTDASTAIETPTWVKFLGRFHIVALHLPVGVLALAAIMEFFVFSRARSSQFLAPATTFALMVGAAGAVVAVVLGSFLARKGGFGFAEFYAHQALGLATAVGALLTLVLKLSADSFRVFLWPYRLVFGLTLVVLAVGAHFGGNMVHESDYLTKYAPAPVRDRMEQFEHFVLAYFEPEKRGTEVAHDQPPVKAGSQAALVRKSRTATVYAALVAPILADRCTSCHDAEKSKADLRLDTHEFIMKGSANGEVVVAGQPDKSRLIECMVLPPDDDDHMPPPKKPQPTAEEIALLSWWVKEGASKTLKVDKARVPEELKLFVKAQLTRTKTGSTGGAPPLMLALAQAAAQADPVVAEVMKKINGSGASLAPVAADARELRFTALNVAKDYTDASLKDLEPVAGKIVALDLAKTKITDNALASIAKMTALRELHLENTAVTDAGAAQLKTLANLEYLNLYGTKVTDKALVELDGLAKLKALYLWQSGVTKAGVDAFKARHPGAVVNAGWTEADNAKVVAVAATKPAPPAPAPAKTAAPATPKSAPAKAPAAKAPDPNALVYKDIVAPIIGAKCAACHGAEKSKGKLRMHTFADLMKGGSDGATTVVAGKPAESLMITRTLLPLDDDDHMPPKDEKQATKEEIAILKWWIEQGASESLTLANARKTPEIEGALKALATSRPPRAGRRAGEGSGSKAQGQTAHARGEKGCRGSGREDGSAQRLAHGRRARHRAASLRVHQCSRQVRRQGTGRAGACRAAYGVGRSRPEQSDRCRPGDRREDGKSRAPASGEHGGDGCRNLPTRGIDASRVSQPLWNESHRCRDREAIRNQDPQKGLPLADRGDQGGREKTGSRDPGAGGQRRLERIGDREACGGNQAAGAVEGCREKAGCESCQARGQGCESGEAGCAARKARGQTRACQGCEAGRAARHS